MASFLAQDYPWVAGQFVVLLIQALLTLLIIRANAALARDTHDLASSTREQVKASLESMRLTDRHHQESLAPIVIPTLGLYRDIGQGGYSFTIKGTAKNVGGGPALGIEVKCTPSAVVEHTVWSGVLGAGAEATIDFQWIVSRDPTADYSARPWPFDLVVNYKNVFDEPGSYAATSHSGESRDLRQTRLQLPAVRVRLGSPST